MESINLSSTKNEMNINDLDNYSLLTIFDLLNIADISNCSLINRRWYLITKNLINLKKKNLALYFGLDEYNKLNKKIDKSIKYRSFEPLFIEDNQLLSKLNELKLESIEKLKLITNQNFKLDQTFNFNLLPNLTYLETNDNELCEFILIESRINNLKFDTIRYLNLRFCSLDVIVNSFSNLTYLELDYLNLDTFNLQSNKMKLNYLIINEDKLSTTLIDCLINNFINLKYLEIKLNDTLALTHLDRLFRELSWCKHLNLFTEIDDCCELKQFIRLNSQLFKNSEFKLFINLIRIQIELNNLETIYPLTVNGCFNIWELKKLSNDNRLNKLNYFNRIKSITIIDNKQIDKYELFYSKLINLDELIIYENPIKHQFNLTIDRLNKLPKTIKRLCFKFTYECDQSILDELPKLFPNLIKLTLHHLGNKEYDLNFIQNFKFINQLCLIDLSISNSIDLIDAFKNCKFLSKLDCNYLEKKISFDKTNLLEQIQLKQLQNQSLKYETDLFN